MYLCYMWRNESQESDENRQKKSALVCLFSIPCTFAIRYTNIYKYLLEPRKKELPPLLICHSTCFTICFSLSFNFLLLSLRLFCAHAIVCLCVWLQYSVSGVSWDSKGVFSFLNVKYCLRYKQGGDEKKIILFCTNNESQFHTQPSTPNDTSRTFFHSIFIGTCCIPQNKCLTFTFGLCKFFFKKKNPFQSSCNQNKQHVH